VNGSCEFKIRALSVGTEVIELSCLLQAVIQLLFTKIMRQSSFSSFTRWLESSRHLLSNSLSEEGKGKELAATYHNRINVCMIISVNFSFNYVNPIIVS